MVCGRKMGEKEHKIADLTVETNSHSTKTLVLWCCCSLDAVSKYSAYENTTLVCCCREAVPQICSLEGTEWKRSVKKGGDYIYDEKGSLKCYDWGRSKHPQMEKQNIVGKSPKTCKLPVSVLASLTAPKRDKSHLKSVHVISMLEC